jgi:hypothetical protein
MLNVSLHAHKKYLFIRHGWPWKGSLRFLALKRAVFIVGLGTCTTDISPQCGDPALSTPTLTAGDPGVSFWLGTDGAGYPDVIDDSSPWWYNQNMMIRSLWGCGWLTGSRGGLLLCSRALLSTLMGPGAFEVGWGGSAEGPLFWWRWRWGRSLGHPRVAAGKIFFLNPALKLIGMYLYPVSFPLTHRQPRLKVTGWVGWASDISHILAMETCSGLREGLWWSHAFLNVSISYTFPLRTGNELLQSLQPD